VVDANTLEHPEWGQVVDALKKKYNAKVFVANYPNVYTVRKVLNEYMPWYVCFVAQPEQATPEMITAAAHTMTWLDDDPYEDAVWAVLTGFVAEDALRIVDAEPLVVRKMLSNFDGDWLDWLESGVSLNSVKNNKFIKKRDGVKQQLEGPKETIHDFIEVLNQDECDIISTGAHATEYAFYLGYPNTASDGYITHNEKGDIYGVDTLGKIHRVNTKKPKIYYSPGNCLTGHIDGQYCLTLAWIHNGANAFFGHIGDALYPNYAWAIAEYFMALQGRYTFAEATYANWLALRFSVDEQLEVYLCCDKGGKKGTVLYGDPAWEARVKNTTVPAYTQDLNIEHLSDGLIKMTVSVTVNSEWDAWRPAVRPVVLLPFRIKEPQIKYTDLDKVGVADNFIVLDLDAQSIGASDLPVGTKKSVVLHARRLEAWPFISDNEVVTRVKERKLANIAKCIGFLTDESVDPNERAKKAATWDWIFKNSEVAVASREQKTKLLNNLIRAVQSDHPMIRCKAVELLGHLQMQPSESIPILQRALKDDAVWKRANGQISVRSAAMSSLGMFGKDAKDTKQDIVQLLPDLSSNEKTVALRTLGKIDGGDDEVFNILRKIITDPDHSVDANENRTQQRMRLAAIEGLGSLGIADLRVREILFSLTDDESYMVRGASMRLLGSAEKVDDEILKALVNGLEDRTWPVRMVALRGLTSFD